MKASKNKIIAAVLVVGVLGSIGKFFEDKEEQKSEPKKETCNIQFDDFAIRGEKNYMKYLYVKVSNYNKNDSTCKAAIYEHFKKQKATYSTTICVNYLDNFDFDPPRDGRMFGSNFAQDKVIVQMSTLVSGKEEIEYDPFGTGKY